MISTNWEFYYFVCFNLIQTATTEDKMASESEVVDKASESETVTEGASNVIPENSTEDNKRSETDEMEESPPKKARSDDEAAPAPEEVATVVENLDAETKGASEE